MTVDMKHAELESDALTANASQAPVNPDQVPASEFFDEVCDGACRHRMHANARERAGVVPRPKLESKASAADESDAKGGTTPMSWRSAR